MFRSAALANVRPALPDLAPYRHGNTGVPYVTTFDSRRPGPHVLLNALTHGNEICGAQALDWLFRQEVRPKRGKLTLSFANVEAYARFDPQRPYDSRYVDEDLNRVWAPDVLGGGRTSGELKRARALLPIVESADFLLDVHSMHLSSPPLMLCGMHPRALALARRMGLPGHLVRDPGHDAGRRMRDYGAFDDPDSPRTALLIECGQHWDPSSESVAQQTVLRFLGTLDCVAPAWPRAAPAAPDAPAPGRDPRQRPGHHHLARLHLREGLPGTGGHPPPGNGHRA